MNDEYIKEITIAMINNNNLCTGSDNVAIAKNIAEFINTLRDELNNYFKRESQ